jgi:hypothetical protein
MYIPKIPQLKVKPAPTPTSTLKLSPPAIIPDIPVDGLLMNKEPDIDRARALEKLKNKLN